MISASTANDSGQGIDEVIQCSGCQAFNHGTDKYCACCGTPLHRLCRHCGACIDQPVAFYCTQCGGRIGQDRE